MRKIVYTFLEVQCSVFVGRWQVVAPNGLLAAMPFFEELDVFALP